MNQVLKRLVVGTLPAVCGAVAVPAFAEKIAWPDSPSPQLSFPKATQATQVAIPEGGVLLQPVFEVRPAWLPEANPPRLPLVAPGQVINVNGGRF